MFLYPPRPTAAIAPEQIPFFVQRGYWGQFKLNGTCTVVSVDGDNVETWTRHAEPHKRWSMPTGLRDSIIETLGHGGRTILAAELLHNKVAGGPKDTLYLFDTMEWDGESLVGEAYRDRWARIWSLVDTPEIVVPISGVTDGLSVAGHFQATCSTWNMLLGGAMEPWVEGIVLKNPNAKLQDCRKKTANAADSVKCRLRTRSYAF